MDGLQGLGGLTNDDSITPHVSPISRFYDPTSTATVSRHTALLEILEPKTGPSFSYGRIEPARFASTDCCHIILAAFEAFLYME